MAKKKTPDTTGNDGGLHRNHEEASWEKIAEILKNNMQEIAHLSALAQEIMQRVDVKEPEDLQMVFEALRMIEEVTGCTGDGSLEFWSARFAQD